MSGQFIIKNKKTYKTTELKRRKNRQCRLHNVSGGKNEIGKVIRSCTTSVHNNYSTVKVEQRFLGIIPMTGLGLSHHIETEHFTH